MDKKTISNINIVPLHKVIDRTVYVHEPLPNFSSRSNFIMGIIACTGSGKSVLVANLLRRYYKNIFDKVYFCSSNVTDENKVYDESYSSIKFDELRTFNTIDNTIIEYIKEDITSDEDFEKDDFRTLIIIDDLITEIANKRNKDIIKFILKSRHLKVSIILISHKYNMLPAIIRNNLTHIILLRTKSNLELDAIYKGIIDIPQDKFLEIYHDATDENHSFLYSVLNKNPQEYYKNFSEKYII